MLFPRRRSRWSADAPYAVPGWGRPPPRLAKGQKAWAAQQSWSEYEDRFEELETEDDGLHGVQLDHGYGQKRFVSDELRFTGIDMGGDTRRRRSANYNDDYPSEGDDDYDDDGRGLIRRGQMQMMLRSKEDELVERALERIRRARALGKPHVKLSRAEIDALERLENGQNPPRTPPMLVAAPKAQPKGKKATQTKQKAIEAKKPAKGSKSTSNSPKPKPKDSRTRGQSTASNRSSRSEKDEALVPYPISPDEMNYPGYFGRPAPNARQQEARAGSSRSQQAPAMQQYRYPYSHHYNSQPDVLYGHRPPSDLARGRSDPSDPNWNPRARSTSSLVNYPLDSLPQQATAGTGRAPRFDPADPRFASPPTRRIVSGPPQQTMARRQQDELFLDQGDQAGSRQARRASASYDGTISISSDEDDGDEDNEEDSDESSQGVQVNVEERSMGYAIQTRANAKSGAAGKVAAKRRR